MNQHVRVFTGAREVERLGLGEAYRRWSDPDDLARLEELHEACWGANGAWSVDGWLDETLDTRLLDDWWTLDRKVETAFLDRIRSGELMLTAYADPLRLGSVCEVVPPELLDDLDLVFVDSLAHGSDFKLVHLKVHATEPQTAPELWRGGLPTARPTDGFTHNGDYTRVAIQGMQFDLSGGLCQIVRLLHDARGTPSSWLNGKQLLADCGYQTSFMGDAFKRHPSWRRLVEGNGRGLYRLNTGHG